MKKSLLALAVLGAFAGVASAQSSVTLFGVVDLNVRYVDNGAAGSQWQMNQDGINSSRLGFRGTEDLGGGMSAGFWLEGSLNPQNGTATGQNWQRRSTLSLSGNFGELRFGRDYTATFWNQTVYDPFGTNGVGASSNIYLAIPGLPTGGAYGTAVRDNNMFQYYLPSGIAGGLYGNVQAAPKMATAGQEYFAGRLGYAAGPFNVSGAYGKTTLDLATDTKATLYSFGGSWDFKFLFATAFYGRMEIGDATQSNWYVGGTMPFGLWSVKASYGQMWRDGSAFSVNISDQKANQFAIGGQYDVSKRTALYATWAGINNKGGTKFTVGSVQNGPAMVANENSSGFELGVRHAF